MNIAKIIHSGIPKVGEAYMSDNISYIFFFLLKLVNKLDYLK